MINQNSAYQALLSRDQRFDGVFFVAVKTTKIYCRPICPVKTPLKKNCLFFENAEAAEKASFRPCLRCRPELAPGNAPIDSNQRIAYQIAQHLGESSNNADTSLESLANDLQLSSRQIRRIINKEFGVSPLELIISRRLLLAKQLLTETPLPITEIAFASGFQSLRRFNAAFLSRYKMPPTRLRKQFIKHATDFSVANSLTLNLAYRRPYDWHGILAFLKTRMIKDVEYITNDFYSRTVKIGKHVGWIKVTNHPTKSLLQIEIAPSLTPVILPLLARLRHLFDLNSRPDIINAHLSKYKKFQPYIKKNPGLRVPGAFDGYEMAIRAILGQQITIKAATTISCRFADAFGEKVQTPFPELTRLTPTPGRVAKATIDDIAKLGIIRSRTNSILAISHAIANDNLHLNIGIHPQEVIEKLIALPGIGAWTAHYIAMRALRWPDAFPKEDVVIRKKLGALTAKQAEQLSQLWRPWRSYAVLHIWNN